MSNGHEEEALGKAYDSRLMKRLLEYLRPYRWRVILALALVAIVTPLELAPPILFQRVIDRFLVPGAGGAIPMTRAWHGVILISVVYLAVLIFDFLAQYTQIRIMQRVGQQTMYDMRTQIFGHLQRLPMSYFDRNPVGRLMTRVTTDVDALNDLFAAGVVTMINDFFLLAVMAGLLFWIDKGLALDTMLVLPFILVVTLIFRKYVREANRKIRTAIARINSFLQEYISGMSVVQLFNREMKARKEFSKRNKDNMLAWRDAILAYALFYPAVEFLSFATIALIYWSGGNRILSHTLSIGVLIEFTMFAQRFFRPIQDLSEKFNILQSAMAASERIFKLLDRHKSQRADTGCTARGNRVSQCVVLLPERHGTEGRGLGPARCFVPCGTRTEFRDCRPHGSGEDHADLVVAALLRHSARADSAGWCGHTTAQYAGATQELRHRAAGSLSLYRHAGIERAPGNSGDHLRSS
jgi:ATP-binding cassette subfamily B multidrug efflux pump